jgi:hypothetical protein
MAYPSRIAGVKELHTFKAGKQAIIETSDAVG